MKDSEAHAEGDMPHDPNTCQTCFVMEKVQFHELNSRPARQKRALSRTANWGKEQDD
jgi:hypothetical protein